MLAGLLLGLLAGCGAADPSWRGSAPDPSDVPTLHELVELVNDARADGRSCGARGWRDPAPPLATDPVLMGVAQAHSDDQQASGRMSHVGSDGRSLSARVGDAGYAWRALGENVAWGYASPEAVMAGWLASDGHCANLMNPAYEELGVGLAGSYWTQVFAAPR